MKVRTAIRKTVKWGGAVAVVLLVAVWVASGWWCFGWHRSADTTFFCNSGLFGVETMDSDPFAGWGGQALEVYYNPRFRYFWWTFAYNFIPASYRTIPIWIPTLLVLIPTTLAWWLDRRATRPARTGHCPTCGYDRRGLAAGAVCPECGAAASAIVPC